MAVPDPTARKPAINAAAAHELGQGWKVRPFLRVDAGQTATLMDVQGSGIIQHIWIVENINRGLVLRCYWDGEEQSSVECPVPDFFAVGHGTMAPVNSLAVTVVPKNALSCFWPMPFRQRARITLTNETDKDVTLVAYQITYVETDVPPDAGTFHAQYRQAKTGDQNPYVILDGVKGRGRYVGTFLAWTQMEKGWFGEGEIKFYMDGDKEFPTICGTGTEDYFWRATDFPRRIRRSIPAPHCLRTKTVRRPNAGASTAGTPKTRSTSRRIFGSRFRRSGGRACQTRSAFSAVGFTQRSISSVARTWPWAARACAPMTRCSTLSSRKAFSISTKC
jgi:hypothetical protein